MTARLSLDPAGQRLLTLRTSFVDGAAQIHDPARELGTLAEETAVTGKLLEQRASLELPLAPRVAWGVSALGGVETLDRRDGGAEQKEEEGEADGRFRR